MIYMLNLGFDTNDPAETTNARFQDYVSTQPVLQQSKTWLKATVANPDANTAGDWASVSNTADQTALQLAMGDQVWVRVWGANTSGYCARITIVVARDTGQATKGPNNKPLQQRASPFPLGSTTQSCVLYDTDDPIYQAPVGGSWVTELGPVTFVTTPPNRGQQITDAYKMVVAATVGQGSAGDTDLRSVTTYSHDPEFEIDLNG